MDYDYSELVRKAQKWSEQSFGTGWVSQGFSNYLKQSLIAPMPYFRMRVNDH